MSIGEAALLWVMWATSMKEMVVGRVFGRCVSRSARLLLRVAMGGGVDLALVNLAAGQRRERGRGHD